MSVGYKRFSKLNCFNFRFRSSSAYVNGLLYKVTYCPKTLSIKALLLILMDKISNNMLSNFKPFSLSPALFNSLEELQGEMNCLTLEFGRIVIALLILSI